MRGCEDGVGWGGVEWRGGAVEDVCYGALGSGERRQKVGRREGGREGGRDTRLSTYRGFESTQPERQQQPGKVAEGSDNQTRAGQSAGGNDRDVRRRCG